MDPSILGGRTKYPSSATSSIFASVNGITGPTVNDPVGSLGATRHESANVSVKPYLKKYEIDYFSLISRFDFIIDVPCKISSIEMVFLYFSLVSILTTINPATQHDLNKIEYIRRYSG